MTALALCLALLPQAEPQVLFRDVRDEKAGTDLVFLPDGFQTDEVAAYRASVERCIHLLEIQSASFFRANREAWNVHVAFVPSQEACPSELGATARRTAFATRLETEEDGGMFTSDDEALHRAAEGLAPGVDCTIVIVRSQGPIAFATGDLPGEGSRVRLPEGFEAALLHELGHSLYGLGDEYTGAEPFPAHERAAVAFYPNVTLDPSGERFRVLTGKPVGVQDGALGFSRGVFRAAGPCVMQRLDADRFCPPCSAILAAGRPAGFPEVGPSLEPVVDSAPLEIRLTPRVAPDTVVRTFALLVSGNRPEPEARELFRAAQARVSRKTRYMESAWIGDGSRPGERVFSLEGHVRSLTLEDLAPGEYTLLAASANLLGCSEPSLVRLVVP